MSLSQSSQDYQILLDTVFTEAGGQPEECQRAVAWVIKNRADMNRPKWGGNTIAGVCVHPGQFECWKDDKRHMIAEGKRKDPQSLRTLDAWLPEVYLTPDPTGGADRY
jgi:N-acetylmuramoyl-L-alanine amidase